MTRSSTFAGVVKDAVRRRGVALMGVCNVTPDSFSDGGRYLDPAAAMTHVDALLAAGADIVDVGGESTRPGSPPVEPRLQIERVVPVVRHAASRGACVSIDTTCARVAEAALEAGALAINDVSLLAEDELARVAARTSAALILSHARAPQETMRGFGEWPLQDYTDIVADVLADWEKAATRAVACGVSRSSLVMDPGLGFSKASRHSAELLARCSELVGHCGEIPVLIGASRKSFLTLFEAQASAPTEREGASISAALHAVRAGAKIVRVHDVHATRQAIDTERGLDSLRRAL
jgi:dihydropteroate synthase